MSSYDTIVIGGGASGMMAAGRAAELGKKVLLLEKNRTLGRKLSITGGGRCNITNAEEDVRVLLPLYGEAEKFLYSPFSQFGVKDTFTFFESRGMPLVVEARKRVFPVSQSALEVAKLMKEYVMKNGVQVRTGTIVEGFEMKRGTIIGVRTNNGIFSADTFILATGGNSHQETGSTGEGLSWLEDLGHTVHDSNPDIVPLKVSDEWIKSLSGTSLSFMKITFGAGKEKIVRKGKVLFTHFGLSGPLILNAANAVKKLLENGSVHGTIDLYPDTEVGTLRNRALALFDQNKNKSFKNIIKDLLPAGMTDACKMLLPENLLEKKVHSVSKEERNAFVAMLKGMPFTVTGTMGYEWAVVSDGGVELQEVDTKTMASKIYPNLFFTGDVLHISRPTGGYSLQLCWTTGFIAGNNC